ncbi:hypothetical protein ACQP2K_05000 [Microbispora siamensis]
MNIGLIFGDARTAFENARRIDLDAPPVNERKATVLLDTSQAFLALGKHDRALQILRAAGDLAPEEITPRPDTRRLVRDILATAARQRPTRSARVRRIPGSHRVTDTGKVLYVIVCTAGPAGDVGKLVALAHDDGWIVQIVATPNALGFIDVPALETSTSPRWIRRPAAPSAAGIASRATHSRRGPTPSSSPPRLTTPSTSSPRASPTPTPSASSPKPPASASPSSSCLRKQRPRRSQALPPQHRLAAR